MKPRNVVVATASAATALLLVLTAGDPPPEVALSAVPTLPSTLGPAPAAEPAVEAIFMAAPHPACAAAEHLAELQSRGALPRPSWPGMVPHDEADPSALWRRYTVARASRCFKADGRKPGIPHHPRPVPSGARLRNAGLEWAAPWRPSLPPAGRYALRSVVVHGGKLHSAAVSSPVRLPLDGQASMLKGQWPQAVAHSVPLHPLPPELRRTMASAGTDCPAGWRCVDGGFYQTPTDFLSAWHVVAEVITGMVSALVARRPSWRTAVVVTARPAALPKMLAPFSPRSCHFGEGCLRTQWATLYRAAFHAALGHPVAEEGAGLGPSMDHDWMVGLRDDEGQRPPVLLAELLVGAPPHADVLWGSDAAHLALAADPTLPGAAAHSAAVAPAVSLIHRTLAVLHRSAVALAAAPDDAPPAGAPFVTLVSRRGDWARHLVNEFAVAHVVDAHLHGERLSLQEAGARLDRPLRRVQVLRLTAAQGLPAQIRAVRNCSVYIGVHGANLLPLVYLRPNSGVVTLELNNPGFFPFAAVPPWLHWRRALVAVECRRAKGKCQWDSLHSNPVRMEDRHMAALLAHIDAIRADQARAPRSL